MKNRTYSIKDLEVLTGIKAHTFRIWEKRYNLLIPQRTDTNIRYYTDEELRKALNISFLVKHGYKISKVSKWDEEKINTIVLELSMRRTSGYGYLNRLILSMVNFDNQSFHKYTEEIISEMGFEEAFTQVFFELFVRLGTYWQIGSVFPAQEHYVTNIIRQKLIAEIDKLKVSEKKRKNFLFFLPENELHEMSLLFYSYLAGKMGYNVIYLGQFVPWDDLVKMKEQVRVDLLFTAFVNSMTREALEQYVVALKELFHTSKIYITGMQLQRHDPKLPRSVKVVKDYQEFQSLLG
ncbi:MAG: MerR family transcriptional regulator [Mariniphaga sp.]|nr:MerR family transcriptional regulator [Mariniphaga sp.]MDD4224909.1 MerR family transcriptional regulator [Mariniphaga sp.]MDD4425179.1 MerR family transcriptional regulator [Mariniphaga sp.]